MLARAVAHAHERASAGMHAMRGAVRLRDLTPAQELRIETLRRVSRLLDSALEIPGTSYRIGLDPIVGLVPWVGDLVSPLFTIAILWQAHDLRLPRVVQFRMIVNAVVDMLVGMIPLAGDLFDFAWKANDMNMALLERHAYEERHPSAGDWIFVLLAILVVIIVAIIPFLFASWLVHVARTLF